MSYPIIIIDLDEYQKYNIFTLKKHLDNSGVIYIDNIHFSQINSIKKVFKDYHIYYSENKKRVRIANKNYPTNYLFDYKQEMEEDIDVF